MDWLDPTFLSRVQFLSTSMFHYVFVPLTLGLSLIVAVMQTIYFRTGKEVYKRMTKFWGKLFVINFAFGVATGIVQEFQFGMNWSEYSRFVGDIFGAPLAIEALMAFFIESTFLGMWIFGWDKLPKAAHLASIWLVAFAANLSSLWILVANSWMQHPVGYVINNGRAEMVDFLAVVTNPNVVVQFPHVVLAGFVTGAFFVTGVSAYRLLMSRDTYEEGMFRRSMVIGLIFGLSAVMFTMTIGHMQGQVMANHQPMKLAAAEGLWNSEDPAGLSFFQIGDEADRRQIINVTIPSLLSFMTYNTPDGLVQGINDLQAEYEQTYGPGNYVPPLIPVLYWGFRAMVGFGGLMSLLAIAGLFFAWRGKLSENRLFLWLMVGAIVLPHVANMTGWTLTELGRQPWIVFGLMTVEEATSPNLTPGMMLISLIGFTLLYLTLLGVDFYLLWKHGSGESSGEILPQPSATDELSPSQVY